MQIARYSVFAYLGLVGYALFGGALTIAGCIALYHGHNPIAAWCLVPGLAILAYGWVRYLELASFQLHIDDDGIGVTRGAFSWQRGTILYFWNDIERVGASLNLISKLTKSYDFIVFQRYTEKGHFSFRNIFRGGDFASEAFAQLRRRRR